jgi:phage terminase small subunit
MARKAGYKGKVKTINKVIKKGLPKKAIAENNEGIIKDLNEKQKEFCKEYVFDWNATRAYKKVYGITVDNVAKAASSRLLTNVTIKEYIEEIQKDLEKLTGLSKSKVLAEWQKIAFSSIADLHNTWIELKEFNKLTDDQKAAIESIDTKTVKRTIMQGEEPLDEVVEYVKIKLYSKKDALENITKMLGYNEPDKLDINGGTVVAFLPMKDPEPDYTIDENDTE